LILFIENNIFSFAKEAWPQTLKLTPVPEVARLLLNLYSVS